MEYNTENIEKLAARVVDDMDMDRLIGFAVDAVVHAYESYESDFHTDAEGYAEPGEGDSCPVCPGILHAAQLLSGSGVSCGSCGWTMIS